MVNDLVVVLGFEARTLFRGSRPRRRSFRKSITAFEFFGVTDVTPRPVLS
jgi:hypothetical protein